MRLAVDARMLNMSGIGTYLKHSLLGIIKKNSNNSFFLLGNVEEITSFLGDIPENVEIIAFDAPIYSLSQQWRFPVWKIRNCDALWVPHYDVPLLWYKRMIVTVHDLAHLALPEIFGGIVKQVYAKLMFKFVKYRASELVYVSNFSKNEFSRLVGKPKSKETVIYNGVDEEWFNIKSDKNNIIPYLVCVGNVKPHKNLIRLLEAFELIHEKIPHTLKIVGKRDGFITGDSQLADISQRLESRIQFTGFLSDEDLKRTVAGADALVMPSLYEGFGLPPLEAMACGTPSAVSNVASLPEVVGDAAILFNPYDVEEIASSILELCNNKHKLEEFSVRGRARANIFKWDTSVNSLYIFLEESVKLKEI